VATDDLQVLVTGNATAPATFTVPGNGQIRPKAVFASFDGTGAGGDFQPALKVTSDGGELVGIYPCSTTVTAGASADVSWFRGLGAGTTTTYAQWFIARRTTTLTMSAGTEDTIPWSDLTSSDSTLFSLGTDNHPNDAVQVARQGVVIFNGWALPGILESSFTFGLVLGSTAGVSQDTWAPDWMYDTKGLPGALETFGPNMVAIDIPDQVPDQLITRYHNFDASSRVLQAAQMWGLWWPTATLSPF
jgi:hypothetical protein